MLTDIQIKKANPKDKVYKLKADKGLFLLVHPKGGKYWRARYSFAKKENEIAIGTYPEISLVAAREKCMEIRKMVAAGIDPGAKKKEEKRLAVFDAANTFKAVADDWHNRNKKKWTPDHAEQLKRGIRANRATMTN